MIPLFTRFLPSTVYRFLSETRFAFRQFFFWITRSHGLQRLRCGWLGYRMIGIAVFVVGYLSIFLGSLYMYNIYIYNYIPCIYIHAHLVI